MSLFFSGSRQSKLAWKDFFAQKPADLVDFCSFSLYFFRYLLLKTHQLSLDAFLVALKYMKVEDVDIDEVQCILANLIFMVCVHHSLFAFANCSQYK